MKLSKCEVRPGIVRAVCNNYGAVKASCIGLFDDEEDIDKLPPVFPFFKLSNSSFSEPQIGDQIWIFINMENPQQLLYVFQGDAVLNDDDVLSTGYDDCEVVSKRGDGQMMWSDAEGWNIKHGDSSIDVDMNGTHLSCGGEEQPAVLGNSLINALQKLVSILQNTAAAAQADPHTAPLAATLQSGLVEMKPLLNKVLSKNHTLD